MKILFRILMAVFVLVLLAALTLTLALLIPVPGMSPLAMQMTAMYPWLPTVLAGAMVFFIALSVLALILLISVPVQKHHFVLSHGIGRIEISKQSIESVAQSALAEVEGLGRTSAHLRGTPSADRLKIYIKAEPKADTPLVPLAEKIQGAVSGALAACLEIQPEVVQVSIQAVEPGAGRPDNRRQMPRVV